MSFISDITSAPWKMATIGAGVLTLIMGGFMVSTHFQNNRLEEQIEELNASINDPKTGYVAQLVQAKTNFENVKQELEYQNRVFEEKSARDAAQLAETKRQLAAAQAATRAAERKIASFLATPPQGDTLEERILDVDRRALEEFTQ